MAGDAECVGGDGESGVYGAAGGHEAGIDDVEIVDVVGAAIKVENARVAIAAESTGTHLMIENFEGNFGL